MKWLKDRDKNSKFFYLMENGRRRGNFIGDMVFDGVKCSNPHNVRIGVLQYITNHYKNVG